MVGLIEVNSCVLQLNSMRLCPDSYLGIPIFRSKGIILSLFVGVPVIHNKPPIRGSPICNHVTRMSATDKPERQQRSLARELGLLLPKLESLRVPIWEGSAWDRDGICFFLGEKKLMKY